MTLSFTISRARLLAVAALALAAPWAMANGQPNVSWSVNVGSGFPGAPVYAPPPPVVYVQPQPVYAQPVYVQPAAVVQYGAPYYVEEVRYRKHHHHHHH
jgi:hypothetical protein